VVPRYQAERKKNKTRALIGSTFGIYSRFRSGMQTKQELVDSINFFNDPVLITVMLVSVLKLNRRSFIEAVMLNTGSAHI